MTSQCMPETIACEFCGRELRAIETPDWIIRIADIPSLQVPVVYETCDCEEARLAEVERLERKWESEAVNAAEDEASRMCSLAARAGIPERYVGKEMDDKALFADLVGVVDSGRGLFLTGGSGVGKTHAACVLAQHYLKRGKSVRFADPEQIEREVMSSWKRLANDTEASVIGRYVATDIVVIDDLGAETLNSTTLKVLRAVISGREANDRVTIFTSNYTREQFAARVAEKSDTVMARRLASRIKGMTWMVPMEGHDRRAAS